MANTKISALTTSAAAAGDLIPVDRSGSNFAVTPASILSGALGPVNASTRVTSGINAMGNVTGAALAINLALGNVITMTLTGNVTSSSFTNALAAAGQEITFIITQDGTGGRTFAWPTVVVPAGIAPVPSLALSSVSVFKATIDGSGNANFAANSPVVVSRFRNSAVTTSVAPTAVYIPPALGVYRIQMTVSCTTAGTTATMAGTIKTNNGNGVSASTAAVASDAIFRNGSINMETWVYSLSGSTCGIDYSTTLVNAIGTAVFQIDMITEYLGN